MGHFPACMLNRTKGVVQIAIHLVFGLLMTWSGLSSLPVTIWRTGNHKLSKSYPVHNLDLSGFVAGLLFLWIRTGMIWIRPHIPGTVTLKEDHIQEATLPNTILHDPILLSGCTLRDVSIITKV